MLHQPEPPVERATLALIASTLFLDFVGLTLVIPLLPFWAEALGAGPVAIGALATSYALAQLAFTPVLGAISDRRGRKQVIFASLLLSAVSFGLTALATSLPALFLARLVGGLGASDVGAAQAVAADVTSPAGRARAMGVVGAAIGLGHVVGPAAGGLLAGLGPAVPFWGAAVLALVNAALVKVMLPETRRRDALVANSATAKLPVWGRLLTRVAIRRLAAVSLLFTTGTMAMETVFALFSQRSFGWGVTENGLSFAALGGVVALVQLGLVGRLAERFGERRLLLAGLALLGGGLALIPLGAGLGPLFAALGVVAIGIGLVSPSVPTLLSFAAPAEMQGTVLGLAQGVTGAGRLLGPLAAGGLFALDPGLPFLAGGVLCVAGLLLALPLPADSRPSARTPAAVAADPFKTG